MHAGTVIWQTALSLVKLAVDSLEAMLLAAYAWPGMISGVAWKLDDPTGFPEKRCVMSRLVDVDGDVNGAEARTIRLENPDQ